MRRRDLLAGLSLVPLAAPAVAQCVLPGFPRRNLPGRCEGDGGVYLDFGSGALDPRVTLTRASTGTYTNASGSVASALSNVARYDYDAATLALRGLLVEEARTNLVIQSTDINAAAWTKAAITVTAPVVAQNQTPAPDGTLACSVTYPAVSAAGSLSAVIQLRAVVAAQHTFSVWLKGSVGGEQLYIDAVIGTTPFYTSPRITLTTQWQRYVLVTPALAGTPWNFCIGTDRRDASQAATPAQTIYVWGAQIEQAATVSSYIPTTAASVTRSADVVTVSVPTGTYATDVVAGTVNIAGTAYVGTATSTAGVLPFAWPAAAVTAGERHLRRLVLRQTG
jgi:hypothetical protein